MANIIIETGYKVYHSAAKMKRKYHTLHSLKNLALYSICFYLVYSFTVPSIHLIHFLYLNGLAFLSKNHLDPNTLLCRISLFIDPSLPPVNFLKHILVNLPSHIPHQPFPTSV